MILELDCGNSLIKWRLVSRSGCLPFHVGAVESVSKLLANLDASGAVGLSACRMVSVRSAVETSEIQSAVAESLGVQVKLAQPARQLGGVVNGYEDFASLGLDRWLAVVGAYNLAKKPCLVIDLGTAATVDLVDANGVHLGGYITPGLTLLKQQLFGHTKRIRYDLADAGHGPLSDSPGSRTADAVERGCRLMLHSYIATQLTEAPRWLGDDFCTYATGGDAAFMAELPGVTVVPDLVFRGLQIACP